MKHALFVLALCAGMASAGSAFAERWVAPINGTLSTIMLPDGDVMMKVQIPAKEFAAITGMMETKHNSCTVFHSTSQGDELNSLILVCGPNRQYIPNY
jgi:hypothetical protein